MSTPRRLDDPVVAGNVTDKYRSRNPLVRGVMAGFDRGLAELLDRIPTPRSVLEVGCGEGHITARLAARFPGAHVVGADRSAEIIATARERHPGIPFEVQDLYELGDSGPWDLIVACEVFEHLGDPARGLEAILRSRPGHVIVTVPREPLWRVLNVASGRHWRTLGDTPGHLQHWSRAAVLRFLGTRLEVLETRSPLPWTQVLARPQRLARS